jgi:hypothetical protein
MLPYFIAILTSISIFFVGYRFKFNNLALRVTMTIASLPLIILTGFKHAKVGTDTGSYIFYFNKIVSFEDALEVASTNSEIGFWLLNSVGHLITDDYYIVFTLSAIIIASCYFYALSIFNYKTLSLATLLLIGPYFFQLNGTRQAIAIAIFAISVIFIIKKQPIRYLASILVGFLFHKSIIICLPLYLIFRKDIKLTSVAVIILIFIIVLVFFQTFINFAASIDERYSSYGDKTESHGGVVVSMFNILLFFWFILCRNANRVILSTRTFDTLLTLYLIGVLISLLSIVLKVDPSGFLRMSLYFIQMNIFLLPMTISSFRDTNTRIILIIAGTLLMTLYFYMATSTFSNLTPYRFNPIIEATP